MSQKTKNGIAVFGELLGLAISLIINIYLLPNLPFITDSYTLWLPVGIATSVISSVFDIAKYCMHKRYYPILKALATIPDVISVYVLVKIFPFDFSMLGYGELNGIIRFALGISIVGMMIAVIVNTVKFATSAGCTEKEASDTVMKGI